MTIQSDPEKNETRTLFEMADFGGKRVLEVGCGDGRLTQLYADKVAAVTAIDPFAQAIHRAQLKLPEGLQDQIDFKHSSIDDFARVTEPAAFDLAILSWSL